MLEQKCAASTRRHCAHHCVRLIGARNFASLHTIAAAAACCAVLAGWFCLAQEVGVAAHKRPRGRVRVVEVQHQRVDALQVRLGRPRPVAVRREPTTDCAK